MSQQQFSYFDPEQETIYEPRLINRDPRELQEYQEVQEETVYYVTPEQSMLRGEKLIPKPRTTPHVNWVATVLFLLMLLFGGLLWAREALPPPGPPPYAPGPHGSFFQKPDYDPPFKHDGHFYGPESR